MPVANSPCEASPVSLFRFSHQAIATRGRIFCCRRKLLYATSTELAVVILALLQCSENLPLHGSGGPRKRDKSWQSERERTELLCARPRCQRAHAADCLTKFESRTGNATYGSAPGQCTGKKNKTQSQKWGHIWCEKLVRVA